MQDGSKFWYNKNSYQEWWIKGEQLNVSSQEEFIRYLKLKSFW